MTEEQSVASSGDPEHWELRLYVAGQTDKSIRAINNLSRICKEHLEGRYSSVVRNACLWGSMSARREK